MIIFALLIAIPVTVFSQDSAVKSDNRIKSMLDNAQIKYTVDDKGLYEFTVNFNDNRHQKVLIESETDFVEDSEVRKVASIGYISKTPLTAVQQNELSARSVVSAIGSWVTIKADNGNYLCEFIAKVPATLDDKHLTKFINFVSSEADSVEKKFSGKDEL